MNYTFLVYGFGNEGRTAWINKITAGTPLRRVDMGGYISNNTIFATNMGNINVNFLDSNNLESGINGIILFLDLTHPNYLNRLEAMLINIKLSHKNVPIVVCGNKSDLLDHNTLQEIQQQISSFIYSHNDSFQYYTISAVSNYNNDKPLQYLLKKLVSYDIILI